MYDLNCTLIVSPVFIDLLNDTSKLIYIDGMLLQYEKTLMVIMCFA